MNKKGGFAPFWIMFGIFGVLLLGAFIVPFMITMDNSFRMFNSNPDASLTCNSENSAWHIKATCFTFQGMMPVFIIYVLYKWISGMINGSRAKGAIFAPRLREMERALES